MHFNNTQPGTTTQPLSLNILKMQSIVNFFTGKKSKIPNSIDPMKQGEQDIELIESDTDVKPIVAPSFNPVYRFHIYLPPHLISCKSWIYPNYGRIKGFVLQIGVKQFLIFHSMKLHQFCIQKEENYTIIRLRMYIDSSCNFLTNAFNLEARGHGLNIKWFQEKKASENKSVFKIFVNLEMDHDFTPEYVLVNNTGSATVQCKMALQSPTIPTGRSLQFQLILTNDDSESSSSSSASAGASAGSGAGSGASASAGDGASAGADFAIESFV